MILGFKWSASKIIGTCGSEQRRSFQRGDMFKYDSLAMMMVVMAVVAVTYSTLVRMWLALD